MAGKKLEPTKVGNDTDDLVFESDYEVENKHLLPKRPSTYGSGSASAAPIVEEPFLPTLRRDFGDHFLTMTAMINHGLGGFSGTLLKTLTPYAFLIYNVPAPEVQLYDSLLNLPWIMKPVIGLLSDVLPVNGYQKTPYLLKTSFAGALGLLYVGSPWLGFPESPTVFPVVVALCVFSLQWSTCTQLASTMVGERIVALPHRGAMLMSFWWGGKEIFSIVALFLSGFLLTTVGYTGAALVGFVPAVLILVPLAMGYLEERQLSHEEVSEVRQKIGSQPETVFLAMVLFIGALLIMFVNTAWQEPKLGCAVACMVGLVVLVSTYILINPVLANFFGFVLVACSVGPNYTGAAFYFFTDTEEMYPEGPHFSKYFYNTVMGTLGAVGGLISTVVYYKYMSTWRYQNVVLVACVLLSLLASLDVLMFTRYNKVIGVPDHALMFSLAVVDNIFETWISMPGLLMMSALCPRGMEGTIYALMGGSIHLGLSISSNIGAFMLEQLDVRPGGLVGESAQFENLWKASVFAAVVPMCTMLVMIRWIPDIELTPEQGTTRPDMRPSEATAGSRWRRWRSGGAEA